MDNDRADAMCDGTALWSWECSRAPRYVLRGIIDAEAGFVVVMSLERRVADVEERVFQRPLRDFPIEPAVPRG